MQVNVEQSCPCCTESVSCQGRIESISGVGLLRDVAAAWSCPECGTTYEQEMAFDLDLLDRSGFHSWVGEVEGHDACIIVEDDSLQVGADKQGHVRTE